MELPSSKSSSFLVGYFCREGKIFPFPFLFFSPLSVLESFSYLQFTVRSLHSLLLLLLLLRELFYQTFSYYLIQFNSAKLNSTQPDSTRLDSTQASTNHTSADAKIKIKTESRLLLRERVQFN